MDLVGLGGTSIVGSNSLLVAIWVLASVDSALNRMAEAGDATAQTLRRISDDLEGIGKQQEFESRRFNEVGI